MDEELEVLEKGGPGSGNFGHAGVPGEVGGSASSGGGGGGDKGSKVSGAIGSKLPEGSSVVAVSKGSQLSTGETRYTATVQTDQTGESGARSFGRELTSTVKIPGGSVKGFSLSSKGEKGYTLKVDVLMDKEVKTKMYDGEVAMVSYIPLGAISFDDVDEFMVAEATAERVKELTRQFQTLAGNILYSPEIEDKGGALTTLVNQLDARLGEAVQPKSLGGKLKEAILSKLVGINAAAGEKLTEDMDDAREQRKPSSSMLVWKEDDAYRWLAIYSNKYMDNDSPPEIISEAAHKEFIGAVERKEAPYPELWHFHVPGTRWGQSDMLAYDDNGFVIASGTVDKGHSAEAEAMLGRTDVRVSHGMWRSSVRYDPKEKGVITRYRTVEISDLPLHRAANQLTGFYTIKEGEEMGLPKDKKDYLKSVGLSDARIGEIEAELSTLGQSAKEADLASKESEAVTPAAPKAPEVEPTTEAAPPGESPAAESTPPVTLAAVAAAVSQIMDSALAPLMGRLQVVETSLAKEKETDQARIAKAAGDTPAASIAALVMQGLSVTRSDAARVPDAFTPATPVEKAGEGGVTGIPWLDKVLAEPAKK